MKNLRKEHPRLIFTEKDWPTIATRAKRDLPAHFQALRERAHALPVEPEADDWGNEALLAVFVGHITKETELRTRSIALLRASLDFYEARYLKNEKINWYSYSRINWLIALDCLWNELEEQERNELARRMLAHVEQIKVKSGVIKAETASTTSQGFYGPQSIYWFAGLMFHKEGINDASAERMLKEGRQGYQEMLHNRADIAGEQGGAISGTLNYSFATYPLAEWNYFYSCRAALGEKMEKQWIYPVKMPRFLDWNWLPGGFEFGFGDTGHTTNRIWGDFLRLHMQQIVHFYKDTHPKEVAEARRMARKAEDAQYSPDGQAFQQGYPLTRYAFLWPYLADAIGAEPVTHEKESNDLQVEFYESMGQIFIRTGTSPEDTYLLISCDGAPASSNHRHYDAGHFTLYHRGFLALDSGTRLGQGSHLQNYYAQTVAHNTLLIHRPNETPVRVWDRTAEVQFGGQYKLNGSKVLSLVKNKDWASVTCDLSHVYHPDKSKEVIRQFVFLKPDTLVIFDRVVANKAEYAKAWLLHSALEPQIKDRQFSVEQGDGRLIVTSLLPKDAELISVGGPGKEFMVGDRNYEIPDEDLPEKGIIPELMGRWRMEVKPGQLRKHDFFLHILEVGDKKRQSTAQPLLKESSELVEVSLKAGGQTFELQFSKKGEPSVTVQASSAKDVSP